MDNTAQEPLFNSGEQQTNNISPTPDTGDKNTKLKLVSIGVLATLVVIGVTAAVWLGFLRNYGGQKSNQTNNQVNQNLTPAPTPLPIDSSAWEPTLVKDEIKTSSDLVENNLIYAVKNGYTSTVYKRSLKNGTQTKIIEFDENHKADKSGNLWSGLPPNIALSPDKKSLAFIDKEGLKVYNLQTKNTKVFIRKTEEGSSETNTPAKWSISSLSETYNLSRPLWSFDGKYISFLQAHYEGASFGMIDTESGTYVALKDVAGGYNNLSWSPASRSYVKASSGGYEETGLYVSNQSNITEATNLAPKFGKTEDTPFWEANFSPDGRKIVFTFGEPSYESYDETSHLAIANTDGTDFTVLAEKTNAWGLFFSSDGNSVLYFQRKNGKLVLVRYNLTNKNSSDLIILPNEFNFWDKPYWTKDGFLAIMGISSSSGLTLGGDSARMLILDVMNKKVIYASPTLNLFADFAGFSN